MYLREEPNKIGIKQQHKAFVLVHEHLKKKPTKYANRNSEYTEFQEGEAVYLKQQHKSKLKSRWYPYFWVTEKTAPVTFHIKNQLDGRATKTHIENIRLCDCGVTNEATTFRYTE